MAPRELRRIELLEQILERKTYFNREG